MKLAEDSRRKMEEFFREILNEAKFRLPEIYFYSGKVSVFLTAVLKIHGIAIGRNIFISPKFVSLADENFKKIHVQLAAHEIAHVIQYRREGFIKFFCKYLRDYLRNLKQKKNWDAASRHEAYLEIPFEIEARAVATKFVDWNEEQRKYQRDLIN